MQLKHKPLREGHFASEKNKKQIHMQLRETDYWKRGEITASQQHTGEFFPWTRA